MFLKSPLEIYDPVSLLKSLYFFLVFWSKKKRTSPITKSSVAIFVKTKPPKMACDQKKKKAKRARITCMCMQLMFIRIYRYLQTVTFLPFFIHTPKRIYAKRKRKREISSLLLFRDST